MFTGCNSTEKDREGRQDVGDGSHSLISSTVRVALLELRQISNIKTMSLIPALGDHILSFLSCRHIASHKRSNQFSRLVEIILRLHRRRPTTILSMRYLNCMKNCSNIISKLDKESANIVSNLSKRFTQYGS